MMRCKACDSEQASSTFFCEACGEPLLEGKEIGSFRLLEQIGAGGMGIVYRAEHSRLKTPYAIKVLSPEIYTHEVEKKRFLREAQATAQLRHEHIVFIADFGEVKGLGLYLVMEFLQGKTLKKCLKSGQILPLERTWKIVHQISKTMDYAHNQGIVHRDLKPENIFLLERAEEQDDFIKIFDFGIAKVAKEPNLHATQTGSFLGTPAYMSPEQMQGKVDHRTDIYSLGVILFRMLAGKRPFPHQSLAELIQAKMSREAPLLSSIVPDYAQTEWEKLVACCLQRDPEQRPASMKAVQQWLERIEKEPTSFAIEGTRSSIPPTPRPFLASELPSSEPSDSSVSSSSASSSHSSPSSSGSVQSESGHSSGVLVPLQIQKTAHGWDVPTGELVSVGPKSRSLWGRWLSSYQFTLLLISLLIGGAAGWFVMRRANEHKHPIPRKNALVSTNTVVQRQEPSRQPLIVLKDRGKSQTTQRGREPVPRSSVATYPQRLGENQRPKQRISPKRSSRQTRKYGTHRRIIVSRNKPPKIRATLAIDMPVRRVVTTVSVQPKQPVQPCAGAWSGHWVFVQVKNQRILPHLETQGVWKRSQLGKGWCVQVSSRPTKVTLDGNMHNLATCEFHVSLRSPARIQVLLRDPDDVVAFSDYCLR